MENRDLLLYVSYGFVALFWLPAYIFIIRRGVLDKSFGMPVVALLGNWPWEWVYGLKFDSPCPIVWNTCPVGFMQVAAFASMFLDIGIVYTVFRYGRDKFKNPFVYKYFYPILIFGFIASFAMQYTYISEIGYPNLHHLMVKGYSTPPAYIPTDEGGTYSGFILTVAMGVMFILMLTERNSLEGQSMWIAIFMFLGNVAAFVFAAILNELTPFLNVLFTLTVIVNVVYIVMVYQMAHKLGIDPWTRW